MRTNLKEVALTKVKVKIIGIYWKRNNVQSTQSADLDNENNYHSIIIPAMYEIMLKQRTISNCKKQLHEMEAWWIGYLRCKMPEKYFLKSFVICKLIVFLLEVLFKNIFKIELKR